MACHPHMPWWYTKLQNFKPFCWIGLHFYGINPKWDKDRGWYYTCRRCGRTQKTTPGGNKPFK